MNATLMPVFLHKCLTIKFWDVGNRMGDVEVVASSSFPSPKFKNTPEFSDLDN
jgi:hypothetical protein